MTITLKKQLGLWFGGALICVVALQGAHVLAQPEEKLTANEASRRFGLWVSSDSIIGLRSAKMTNLLTRQNQKDLDYYQLEKLLVAMTEQYAAAGFESRVVSDKSGKAIVRLVPLKDHPGKEVVCVKENGGYKIDLIETYGRWNKLSGAALAKRIYDLTGAVLPAIPRNAARETSQCQTNLKQIALGLAMYSQDYDERLPSTRAWSEVLEPYLKKPALFNCPSAHSKTYGYAFNKVNAGKYLGQFAETWKAVNIFDASTLSKNFGGGPSNLSNRHKLFSNSGANVAFLDGHVKFIGSSYKWNDGRFTFTPQLVPYEPPAYPSYLPGPPPAP